MTTAYIGLGSNLGNRNDFINRALKILAETKETEVARISDIIETTPLCGTNQPGYLNTVAEIKTTLSAEDLHKKLADIETSLGRTKKAKWSPRTIDLDLLLFGDEIINSPDLTVPHRQMHLRSFVLKGLCQLNTGLLHPVIKKPINELAARLGNTDFAPTPNLPQLICMAGVIGVGKTTITKKLSKLLGCKSLFEAYDSNPFMPGVYAGKKELALDSQLYFLTSRIEQLNHDALAPGQIVITDYIFDKELIYATRLLNAQQLALYKKVYQPLAAEVSAPVLVIYLTDSSQSCLDRIHKRNRPYEQRIEPKFLEELSGNYEQLFTDWKTSPVIRISMSNFNRTQGDNIEHLANQIKSYVAA